MKAIILCAGYGERLKPLTNILPKPLFPVVGYPLLGHIIYYLKQFGVNEIGVNTHWLAEKIKEYLGDGGEFGIKFHISHEPQILGIGGGIGAMRDFLNEDIFIVHNGDVLSNINLIPAIEYHKKNKALTTLILHNYPQFNNISMVSNNIVDIGERVQELKSSRVKEFKSLRVQELKSSRVKEFKSLRVQELKVAYTGIAIMSKKTLDFLPYKELCSIVDVWIELIKTHPGSLKGYIVGQPQGLPLHYWAEIGSIRGYLNLHHNILIDRLISNSPVSNICMGKNSTLSKLTSIIGFASIGNNCVIEDKVVLENCIVWDNTIVKSGTSAKNAVFYPSGFLNAE
ncbi:MAG: NDP-sugar synthase [Candidatus Stahlbacteria bacterium]|nr:NDP-sugar synthase [Candidatus Stahlbacteria bacterium]